MNWKWYHLWLKWMWAQVLFTQIASLHYWIGNGCSWRDTFISSLIPTIKGYLLKKTDVLPILYILMENTQERYSAGPDLLQWLLNLHVPCERSLPVNQVPMIYKIHSNNSYNHHSIFTVMWCNEKSAKIHIDSGKNCTTNLENETHM